jgi:hypothetical protein
VSDIDDIRRSVRERDYYLSAHAEEEMAEDLFERADVENAIMTGSVEARLTHDPRGTRYRLEGSSLDGRLLHVVCRMSEGRGLLVVTVYERDVGP